jgi:riboflavin kinase/FMN adenylyltransferase
MTLEVLIPHMEGEQMASSSRVRRAIEQGDLELAASLLTAPYRITGKVITGDRRGRTIGFPTANLSDIETLLPKPGVYAAQARAAGGVFPSAVNIGSRPTFGDAKISVEAHLIGFSGDLYGEQVDLDLVTRLREIQPFGTIEDLKSQLAIDVAHAKEAVLNRESRGPLAQL